MRRNFDVVWPNSNLDILFPAQIVIGEELRRFLVHELLTRILRVIVLAPRYAWHLIILHVEVEPFFKSYHLFEHFLREKSCEGLVFSLLGLKHYKPAHIPCLRELLRFLVGCQG